MRTEFLCISVLRVASGPRVKLTGCGGALDPPVVSSAGRSGAVVPVLVLLFVALWFILRGGLLCVFPCVVLFLCFSVHLVLRLPRLGGESWSWCFSCVCSVCACLGLSVSSSSWGLGGGGGGGAAVCGCGTPWTFLLPFFFILRGDLCLSVCHFVLVFFSPFSIAITSLGEERANLCAFRTFVRFVLVWICLCPLPLGVWGGLRFVIVAFPGLFSYLFCNKGHS